MNFKKNITFINLLKLIGTIIIFVSFYIAYFSTTLVMQENYYRNLGVENNISIYIKYIFDNLKYLTISIMLFILGIKIFKIK